MMMIITLTNAEQGALQCAIEMRHENIIETRDQTGDDEYDQDDEDQCSDLVAWLADYDVDTDGIDLEHLKLPIENLNDGQPENRRLYVIHNGTNISGRGHVAKFRAVEQAAAIADYDDDEVTPSWR